MKAFQNRPTYMYEKGIAQMLNNYVNDFEKFQELTVEPLVHTQLHFEACGFICIGLWPGRLTVMSGFTRTDGYGHENFARRC